MTSASPLTPWYLAQLKPNAHQIARSNLDRQGFETFLPLHKETMRRSGRFHTQLKPLFPGYIFVGLGCETATWRTINATRGVTKLVSFGDTPAEVPAGIMAAFQQRFTEEGIASDAIPLEIGDKVRIAAGPFADLIAQVETVSADKRIWLLLDVLGRKTRISAPPSDLRRTQL